MSVQVQLRGGEDHEHDGFIGKPREITVNTTYNTIHVHDGVNACGTRLARLDEVKKVDTDTNKRIDDMQNNLGGSHNHDDRYSKLDHNHDIRYYSKLSGVSNVCSKILQGYDGLCSETGGDGGWYRTTINGLLPYQSGGYSAIGTSSWRFNDGWFNSINAKSVTVAKSGDTSSIEFPANGNDPGFIRHIENNNVSGLYFSASDDIDSAQDEFLFGASPNGVFQKRATINTSGDMWLKGWLSTDYPHMSIGGRRIYFDGQRPVDAPEGSISFG